jgi:GTPase SAR1 family protein
MNLLGDSNVGKTTFIRRLSNDNEESIIPTIGIDFKSISFFTENQAVHLKFWDTAGQVFKIYSFFYNNVK